MTLPVKFRAWYCDPRDGGWRMDSVALLDLRQGRIQTDEGVISDKFELMQWIGLQDVHGHDLYAGDVCEGQHVFKTCGPQTALYGITHIDEYGKWGAKTIQTKAGLITGLTFPIQHYVDDSTHRCTFAIVGHIYEKPEWLAAYRHAL
ncbi:MAG: YopX family protein [Thermaerobacter sp.]|nr:YopX family protein [Thermaerobacter sp.]